MKKRFTIAGAIVGFLCGSGLIVFTFISAPGVPGIFEILVQAAIVGFLVAAGAAAGLLVGWLVNLCIRKK